MKKILTLITAFLVGSGAFAMSADDALSFFAKYVNDANAQSPKIVDYYEPNAKIIRVVVLPDGKLVQIWQKLINTKISILTGKSLKSEMTIKLPARDNLQQVIINCRHISSSELMQTAI